MKILKTPCRCGLFLFFLLLPLLYNSLPARAAAIKGGYVYLTDLKDHWARTQITRLVALDIVRGYPDHTFQPEQPVSQLEATVLLLRAGGFDPEAQRPAAGFTVNRNGGLASSIPRVPWGQQYLDLAVEKGFLAISDTSGFDYAAPASRLWAAKLLAHVLYLLPPAYQTVAGQDDQESPGGEGYDAVKGFSDEGLLKPADRSCVRAVAAAGVMSGYPDGTFQPAGYLTRAEMSVIINRLLEQGWIKIDAGRCLTGLISSVATQQGGRELELAFFGKVQKLKVAQEVYCLKDGGEFPLEKAAGCFGEIILDKNRQVSWVNLLRKESGLPKPARIRGSVKTVAIGKDSLLVLSDLDCREQVLYLDAGTVITGEKSPKDLASLKPGTFIDAEADAELVTKVTLLEVRNISGQVEKIDDGRLYLKGEWSAKKPGWFNNYEFARIVDKEGVRRGYVKPGEKVQITYLDPLPEEIDDEIPLEIKAL